MHTIIPAPKRVIRLEPMLIDTRENIARRRRANTVYEVMNFLATCVLILCIAAICLILKSNS